MVRFEGAVKAGVGALVGVGILAALSKSDLLDSKKKDNKGKRLRL